MSLWLQRKKMVVVVVVVVVFVNIVVDLENAFYDLSMNMLAEVKFLEWC